MKAQVIGMATNSVHVSLSGMTKYQAQMFLYILEIAKNNAGTGPYADSVRGMVNTIETGILN